MPALPEHAYAVITRDIPEANLRAGDVGVIVHVHRSGAAPDPVGYMLELFAADGTSIGEASAPADAVRLAKSDDRISVHPAEAGWPPSAQWR